MTIRFHAQKALGLLSALFLLAAAPALWVSPASAQQPAATAPPTAGAIAAAKELIALKGVSNMFDPVVPGVIETAKNTLLRTSPNLSKELNDVAALLRQEFAGKRAEASDQMASIYARAFTEAEIKQAIVFYKTPLGQKLIVEEPRVMEQTMSQIQTWADKFADDMITRIRAEMRKKGHNL